jgi:hypothetical protein
VNCGKVRSHILATARFLVLFIGWRACPRQSNLVSLLQNYFRLYWSHIIVIVANQYGAWARVVSGAQEKHWPSVKGWCLQRHVGPNFTSKYPAFKSDAASRRIIDCHARAHTSLSIIGGQLPPQQCGDGSVGALKKHNIFLIKIRWWLGLCPDPIIDHYRYSKFRHVVVRSCAASQRIKFARVGEFYRPYELYFTFRVTGQSQIQSQKWKRYYLSNWIIFI